MRPQKYKIVFAYGGRYPGENQHTVVVTGEGQTDALENFHKLYKSELIISCTEIDWLNN